MDSWKFSFPVEKRYSLLENPVWVLKNECDSWKAKLHFERLTWVLRVQSDGWQTNLTVDLDAQFSTQAIGAQNLGGDRMDARLHFHGIYSGRPCSGQYRIVSRGLRIVNKGVDVLFYIKQSVARGRINGSPERAQKLNGNYPPQAIYIWTCHGKTPFYIFI